MSFELDMKVAVAMGWTEIFESSISNDRAFGRPPSGGLCGLVPAFSTDIGDAFTLVEEMTQNGPPDFGIWTEYGLWICQVGSDENYVCADGQTASEAICLAYLEWKTN